MTRPILHIASLLLVGAAGDGRAESIKAPTPPAVGHPATGDGVTDETLQAEGEIKGASRPQQGTDKPPPSAFDLQRLREGRAPPEDTERTLMGQLLRTLLALAVVVALIYLVVKLALPRLFRTAVFLPGGGGGKALRIVERLQLDARHGIFLVELEEGQRLLLATGGDSGVEVLWHRPTGGDGAMPTGFRSAMQEATRADEAAMTQGKERG